MKSTIQTYLRRLSVVSFAIFTISACSEAEQSSENSAQQADSASLSDNNKQVADNAPLKPLSKDAFKEVEWVDLMPHDDFEALSNPPEYLSEIEDGSVEDQLTSSISNEISAQTDDPYQQALISRNVVPEMAGQAIKIPGFIVPVEFNDQQVVTQFFLVPFFGACIHVPPPPPNQIIFVEYEKGLLLESLYEPFWISGVLETALVENDIATSSYSLKLQHYEKYYNEYN